MGEVLFLTLRCERPSSAGVLLLKCERPSSAGALILVCERPSSAGVLILRCEALAEPRRRGRQLDQDEPRRVNTQCIARSALSHI